MDQQNESIQQSNDGAVRVLMTLIQRLLESMPYVVETFLHTQLGYRYIETRGPFAFLVLVMFPLLCGNYVLWPYWTFATIAFLLHCDVRLDAYKRQRNGDTGHSCYTGLPRLLAGFTWCSEATFKTYFEPVIVIGIAIVVVPFDGPIAVFLFASAVLLFIKNFQEELRRRTQVVSMNDAWQETQMAAERFRNMRGED